MTRRAALTAITLCALSIGGRVPAFAHEGHDHKIMGTVTMAAADHLMLKDIDGKDVTVYFKADTKVARGKTAMKPADIKTSMRVVITAVTEKDKGRERMVAKSIELGVTSAAK